MMSLGGIVQKLRQPRTTYDELRTMVRLARQRFSLGDTPYLDGDALELYSTLVTSNTVVFEYGAGASTLFAATRGARVVSIESHGRFAAAVRRGLIERGLEADVLHCSIGPTVGWGVPFDKFPSQENRRRWRKYVDAPWERDSAPPSFVLVDGRFRVACAAKASIEMTNRRLKGSILLDDYAERPHYEGVTSFCTIKKMAGRMAVLEPKPEAYDQAVSHYERAIEDWR